ncbi:MAG: nucleoside 2-deoxyribosyltransferase [Bacteroidetes bacterium]|nr:nucleoside 2-deoxyribosyltransferase [Bacteroidota bacterium]
MSPNIDEFIKTIRRGKSSYVPVAELGVHPKIKEKIIGRPIMNLKDDVEFWNKMGYDYLKLAPEVDFNPGNIGKSLSSEEKVDSVSNFNWAHEGDGIITSLNDYEKYIFPSAADFNYWKFDSINKYLPEGMGVVGQYGDIFTMTWEMMGFEKFSFALFENPDLIDLLNDKLGELVLSMFEVMAQHPSVDVLWYSDDIAFTNGLLMPPEILDKYLFKWLKKIGELAKKYNKPLIYHSDGVLFEVFESIISCGVDAIHPLEPKAMELDKVKKIVGDKLCLIGHVEVDILSRGKPEDIRQIVRKNIDVAAFNGGYCVGSSNSIPAYVNVENYIEMNKAAKEFGVL